MLKPGAYLGLMVHIGVAREVDDHPVDRSAGGKGTVTRTLE